MKSLVFVTSNREKIEDAVKLLPEYKIEHIDFEVPEIQSFDIHRIVEHKIKFAYEHVHKPCFVLDSGWYLDCLNGFPGPLVRWYFEIVKEDKICQIAHLLKNAKCHWTTFLGYHDGERITYIEETIYGTLPKSPRGFGGYNWDRILVPDGSNKTFAEMSFEEKQSYAVTKKLMDKFKKLLNT